MNSFNNEIAALANDAANRLIDDRPIIHKTVDGAEFTPDDQSATIFWRESNDTRTFGCFDAAYTDYSEDLAEGRYTGDHDIVSMSLGEWLEGAA